MAWKTGTSEAGTSYNWYQQERSQSCGVGCVMMVLRQMQNKILDETSVRTMFASAEGAVNIGHDGLRDFNATGTTQSPIVSVLSKYKISSNQVARSYVEKWIKTAAPAKPAILGVDWGVSGVGQGGHWVVCLSWPSSGKALILDPWYGVTETPSALFPFYFAQSADNGGAVGKGKINDLIQVG